MSDLGLIKYDAMVHAITECHKIDEVKDLRDKARALELYAQQAKNTDAERRAAEIRIRAERKTGSLLRDTEKAKPGPKDRSCDTTELKTLSDMGISKDQSSKWQKLAEIPDDEFEGYITAPDVPTTNGALGGSIVTTYTGQDEWYTPEKHIKAVSSVMGGIDLDPASNALANKVVQATEFFDKGDDGLSKIWKGRVFLNPPYKAPLISLFTKKLISEIELGFVTQAILLTNNSTDTKWWHNVASRSDAACFTLGRISFYRDKEYNAPTNGQVFLYFGKNREKFSAVFSEIGLCMSRG